MGDVANLVESQFEEWSESDENSQSFFMVSCEKNGSGGARIEMMDLTDRTVSLSCSQYDPSSHRARFEVNNTEDPWAESVKEHLGDQESRSLGQVMALVMEAMEAANKMDDQSEEEEDNEDVDMEEYDENEEYENAFSDYEEEVNDSCLYNQSQIDFLFRKTIWLKGTAKLLENLRGELTKESAELFGKASEGKKSEDIFAVEDADKFMVDELERALNLSETSKVHIEPINDVLYQLNVRIMTEAFDEKSVLSQGLKDSGVDCVSFNLFFNPFLYPFSPPEVQMVSPRLVGFSGQPFVSLDVFKPLQYPFWGHTRFLYLFIEDIRGFLQTHAMVEVGSPLGHRYLILEDSIQQLGMLTEQASRLSMGHDYDIRALQIASKKEENKTVWAKGTGYGSGYSSGYGITQKKETVNYHKFLKEKREERIVTLLTEVRDQIQLYSKLRDAQDVSTFKNVSCFGKNSWFWFKTWASGHESTDNNLELFKSLEPQDLCTIIKDSCLMIYLENYFKNNPLLEFNANFELFAASSQVILELATHAYFLPLLANSSDKSIFKTMNSLHKPAVNSVRMAAMGKDGDGKAKDGKAKDGKAKDEKATEEKNNYDEVARYIIRINEQLKQNAKSQITLLENNQFSEASDQNETPQEIYCKALKKLQLFDTTDLVFNVHGADANVRTKQQIMRLANELSILSSSLPCDYSSSIFVRADTSDMSRIRILIIGPEDTPFSNGCYFFDLKFPENFPHSPPLVHFNMAGKSKYSRINPNLYNEGKVCLSLLNTWQGQTDEKWNSASTAFQVLVSIQSLVMVKEPYFNEPGFESRQQPKVGPSQAYKTNTRAYNVEYGIMDPLKNVYPEFEEIVKTHIYLKKEQILKEVNAWVDEAHSFVEEYPRQAENENQSVTLNLRCDTLDVFKKHVVHITGLRDRLKTTLDNLKL